MDISRRDVLKLAGTALVQPFLGVDARNVQARDRIGHGVERAAVVDRSAIVVAQGGLAALVDQGDPGVPFVRDSVLAPERLGAAGGRQQRGCHDAGE